MGDISAKKGLNLVAPLVVALLAGACYYWLKEPLPRPARDVRKPVANMSAQPDNAPAPQGLAPESGNKNPVEAPASEPPRVALNPVAVQYIEALQKDHRDDIVRLTDWMQERLERLRVAGADEQSLAAAAEELQARMSVRDPDQNQVTELGVEDQYVFAPDASVEPLSVDGGREDLDKPAKDRSWVRVTYPTRATAPRDPDGFPIRSMIVGINVSTDGLVLKAAVIGNLEIDMDSMNLRWNRSNKEKGHAAVRVPSMQEDFRQGSLACLPEVSGRGKLRL